MVVLIHDDGPRIRWRLGVVNGLITGKDGLVRAANVRTSTHVTNRPITRLYPLEVSAPTELVTAPPESQTDTTVNDNSEQISQDAESVKLPKRAAARRAMSQLSEWTRELRRPPEDVEN